MNNKVKDYMLKNKKMDTYNNYACYNDARDVSYNVFLHGVFHVLDDDDIFYNVGHYGHDVCFLHNNDDHLHSDRDVYDCVHV